MKSYHISGAAQLMILSFNTLFLVIVEKRWNRKFDNMKKFTSRKMPENRAWRAQRGKKLKVKMGLIKILHWKVEVSVREMLLKSDWVGVEPAHPVEVRRKWVSCITEEWGVKHFSLKQEWINTRVYKSEKWGALKMTALQIYQWR